MATTTDRVRELALALPEVTEADHHGRPSFRLGSRVLATLPEGGGVNVMVGEELARAAAQEQPAAVELLWWGRRLCGVHVHLEHADEQLVTELLDDAWRRRAPARLRSAHPSG